MMKIRTLMLGALCTTPLLLRPAASSAAAEMCKAPHALDKYKLLRRLSLDLRNRVPSFEEYEALKAVDTIPDAVIESYLASDEYRLAMRRHHENQLWPNISNVRISGISTALSPSGETLLIPGRSSPYRGARDAVCDNVSHTNFDPAFPGEFRPIQSAGPNGTRTEGYRMVEPYWAKGTQVKVCASEAQVASSVKVGGKTVSCSAVEGQREAACGCGPNLQHCYFNAPNVRILASFREQLGRASDRVATGKAPYTDLLLAEAAEENGPIAFFRRHLASNVQMNFSYNVTAAGEPTDMREFQDEVWKPTARSRFHAGILTTPAYLLRFQTNRGRANRFRVAFMGQYFVPAAKLEPQQGCSLDSPDLTKRCNCQYCHQSLEPLAAHFGNLAEAGSAVLGDRAFFPKTRADCVGKRDPICTRFYVTEADAPGPGKLLPYQFEEAHPEYAGNIEGGPRKLAEGIIQDGTFAQTVARNLFERLMKRPMKIEGEDASDRNVLAQLAKDFQSGGYSYPSLARAIVSLSEYRSIQ
jgi:hypothetical protein